MYTVLSTLGSGANGTVYLVSHVGQKLAIKVGSDPIDLLTEVNMLKQVHKPLSPKVGPMVCDVDDLVIQGKTVPFYAMEYVEGERLDRYVERVGAEWVPVLIVQLLSRLHILHSQGWSFGDLKPENVIVDRATKQVCLIDFGGVSKHGHAIRQFTEEYDRAYWQAGDRRAEIKYDLFSLAVMMIRLTVGKEVWKSISTGPRQTNTLCDIIRDNDHLYPFRVPLVKAFHGQYSSAEEMKREVIRCISQPASKQVVPKKKGGAWMTGLFITLALVLAGSMFVAWM